MLLVGFFIELQNFVEVADLGVTENELVVSVISRANT